MNKEKGLKGQQNNKKLEFLAEQLLKIYEIHTNDFDKFDQKVSWFLIFLSTVFVYLAGSSNFIVVVFMFLNISLCVYILFPKSLKSPYSTSEILDKYWNNEDIKIEDAQAKIVSSLSFAIEYNKKVLSKKVFYSKFLIISFVLTLFLVIFNGRVIINIILL